MGCKKDNCGCNIPVGERGPQGPQGERGVSGANGLNGTNGQDGVSTVNQTVSDGVTEINGTVYPLNTLVVELSDGTFVDAGIISPINNLVWEDITLLNSWTAAPGFGTPQYAIDNNFVYFRGVITPGNTDNAFSIPGISMSANALDCIHDTTIPAPINSIFIFDTIGSARILNFGATQNDFMLDSVGPISITR